MSGEKTFGKVLGMKPALKNRGHNVTAEDDDEIQFIEATNSKSTRKAESPQTAVTKRKSTTFTVSKRAKASTQTTITTAVQKSIKDFFKSSSTQITIASSSQLKAAASVTPVVKTEIYEETPASELKETPGSSYENVAFESETVRPGIDFRAYEDGYSSGDDIISSIPESVLSGSTISVQSIATASDDAKRTFVSERIPFTRSSSVSKRKCPFYKLLPGTNFSVDAFNFGEIPNVFGYFLSHFHSDHYNGLTRKFSRPIYCSAITARLVAVRLGVAANWIHAVPMNTPVTVDGIELTLLEANHCPGSVLFLFRMRNGTVYLHTGDFRADPSVLGANPFLKNLRNISKLYLDTTYLDPYYEFESQDATVEFAAELAQQYVKRNPKTLIVCGTYSVGKEKIFMRIAECLQCKVAVTNYKLQLLKCFQWRDLDGMLTNDWQRAQVHVLPMRSLNLTELEEHLMKYKNYTEILALLPSGWEFNRKLLSLRDIKPKQKGAVSLYGLPYSEHSSYRELEWFVKFLRPKEVIPTVNVGNPKTREKMQSCLRGWMADPNTKPKAMLKQNSITNFIAVSSSSSG